jgi:hypothetical protein
MAFASEDELLDLCRTRFQALLAVAEREMGLIAELAEAISRALRDWARILAEMELASRLDAPRAQAFVLETVFDETLAPAAWRVLADVLKSA